jgi:hypothetical protein
MKKAMRGNIITIKFGVSVMEQASQQLENKRGIY